MKYYKESLESAVRYISVHNHYFLGQDDYIRTSILEGIQALSDEVERLGDKAAISYATMGFKVERERSEGFDMGHIRIYICMDNLHCSHHSIEVEATPNFSAELLDVVDGHG